MCVTGVYASVLVDIKPKKNYSPQTLSETAFCVLVTKIYWQPTLLVTTMKKEAADIWGKNVILIEDMEGHFPRSSSEFCKLIIRSIPFLLNYLGTLMLDLMFALVWTLTSQGWNNLSMALEITAKHQVCTSVFCEWETTDGECNWETCAGVLVSVCT